MGIGHDFSGSQMPFSQAHCSIQQIPTEKDANMALTHQDFKLTDEQIEAVNQHIEARSRRYAAEDDLPESPTVSVRFDFWVLGRDVTVYFDGEVDGHPIEASF